MWTNDDASDFMRTNYPALYPHYENYRQTIQRANVLRYALLHHYGGVYLDLDVACRVPLDDLLAGDEFPSFLTPAAFPAGVNNAFILTRPGHPFLTKLLERLPGRDLYWGMPYVENMLSTGCMFFTNAWMAYLREKKARSGHDSISRAHEDRVQVLADHDGWLESHMLRGRVVTPLFEHGGASSWHSWDAAAIVLIGKHYGYFAFLGILGCFSGFAFILRLTMSRRIVRRGWLDAEAECRMLKDA
ncbi:glycosyltransferase family 32 protein [Dissoconium aciculare CBS 342.82]|uniref:Glycosyltransferase family 32 protein n=1 Tax=Dissoconium aciculare CBS 342.82 TaxID=1314786 RepID=A0A6J3LY12_9PEZI|nr:glycosyltransferase family 32 protein [Dissoconium aciculare CBS 342.82]KAF1820650.1 glycosyltransferase family 32 protein [Dissoconium aciculare CBS 342.82]